MTARLCFVLGLAACASGSASRDIQPKQTRATAEPAVMALDASAAPSTRPDVSLSGPARPSCLGAKPTPPEHLRDVDRPSTERAELVFRVHRDLPIRCNAKQTNTPCVYQSGAQCFLRSSNCTGMPCSEGTHPVIDCGCAVPGLPAPKRVCVELTGVEPDAPVRVFHEDQFSETGAGADHEGRLRMCAQSERAYWMEVEGRPHGLAADILDWSQSDCVSYDVPSRTLKQSCDTPKPEKPAPKVFENRF